jgi:hypothetical protein
MPLLISDISAVLKKVIHPVIQDQLSKESLLFDKIKANLGVQVMNNYIYVSARIGRNSGIYSVAENTNPRTGKAKYGQPVAPVKFSFGSIELTDQAMAVAKNKDAKALASILKSEIMNLKDDFRMDFNRMYNGAGKGLLCLSNGTGSMSTTLIVDGNPAGLDGTAYLAEGMYIQVGSGAATEITSVDSATQITLGTAQSWANDLAIIKESQDEPMGLAGIIDNATNVATIQSIARSSNPYVNAQINSTTETLTEAMMVAMYLSCRQYGGTDVITTNKTLYAGFGKLLTSMKHSANTKEVLSGGWKGLDFMDGVGVILDFDCWDTYMNFIKFDALTRAEASQPMEWLEADAYGGVLRRSPTVRTNWEGTLKYYQNLVGLKFRTLGALRNKTAP